MKAFKTDQISSELSSARDWIENQAKLSEKELREFAESEYVIINNVVICVIYTYTLYGIYL